jgi:hypothetical protein
MAWIIAGVLYLVSVALVHAFSSSPRKLLGFSTPALAADDGTGTVMDIAADIALGARPAGMLHPDAAPAPA